VKAKSISAKTATEFKQQLTHSLADGFRPTVAIVFMSVKQDLRSVIDALDEHAISIYGGSTHGEFIDENLQQGTIAVLLMDMNAANFFIQYSKLDSGKEKEIAFQLGTEAVNRFSNPAFLIVASSLQTDAEEILAGFEAAAGKNVNVFGAMAGDDFSLSNQFVFTNKTIDSRGIVCFVIDADKVMLKGKASTGWKALGTTRTITRCEGNEVYEIDGQPALDLFLKFSGLKEDSPTLIEDLVTNIPLQLQRENGSPIMRPAYGTNRDTRSVTISGKFNTGARVRFSMPPDFDTVEAVIRESQKLKQMEMPEADALIMFNCAARFLTLGPMIRKEVEGIRQVWNVPMVGFFSSAELGRATDGNLEMHNLTVCYVALKER
jgi:hypothetical protein